MLLHRRLIRPALLAHCCAAMILCWLGNGTLHAQAVTQTISLQPGWNAIFVEVDPEPADTASVFSGLPVESVWLWNEQYGAPQFVQDPANLTPAAPEWLKWFAPNPISNNVSTLNSILGGRAYLVKLTGNQAKDLHLQGRPKIRPQTWIPNTYSLAGFYLDPAVPVSFQTFFAPSPAHSGQARYKLSAAGSWVQITNTNETMQPGQAYWIYTNGPSSYFGPLQIDYELFRALDFGDTLNESRLTIKNLASAARTVTLRKVAAVGPAGGGIKALAGDVPLGYYQQDLNAGTVEYVPLPSPLTLALGATQSNEVRLEVRRKELAPFTPPAGVTKIQYQSILEVTDGAGVRFRIPVTTLPPAGATFAAPAGLRARQKDTTGVANMLTGLWVGQVSIDNVSEPRNSTDPNAPQPTATNFQFRILMHIDGASKARLLQSALIMFREADLGPAAGNPPVQPVITPGRFVIITSDSLLALRKPDGITPLYIGSAVRDGVEVGRRISSANFSFTKPQLMNGNLTSTATVLTCNLVIPFNDPLNPFVHVYHPDHDNKDRQFNPYPTEGTESYTVNRALTLTFGQQSLTNVVAAGYGTRVLDGVYDETITGLHKNPLHVRGTFQMTRVLDVDVLNDGR